jgi:hypothetical protein
MRTLASMIGEVIIVRIPLLDPEGMTLVKLHGVETNGIWIESQQFTNRLMEELHIPVLVRHRSSLFPSTRSILSLPL